MAGVLGVHKPIHYSVSLPQHKYVLNTAMSNVIMSRHITCNNYMFTEQGSLDSGRVESSEYVEFVVYGLNNI